MGEHDKSSLHISQKEGTMAASIIARLESWDEAWQEEYVPKTTALVEKHDGKFLVVEEEIKRLEEDKKLPNRIIVVEFPSVGQAKIWYHDLEYALMIKLRQTGSDVDVIVVEGA